MRSGGPVGRFLTFEGIEGCGKTTQLARLAERFRAEGLQVTTTREPGGTEFGRQLRAILLRPTETPMCAMAELMMYVADRAQHLTEIVQPALDRGDVVLCDRYIDATLAYQGHGRGIDLTTIHDLHRRPPLDLRPTRTILLDVEAEAGLNRARRRDDGGVAEREGRFEAEEIEFHERVRGGYLELARCEPLRFRVVDGSGRADEVAERVRNAMADEGRA